MPNTIDVLIVSKTRSDIDDLTKQISEDLNLSLEITRSISSLYNYLTNNNYDIKYIIIDAEDLFDNTELTMWEIIQTLTTIIKSTRYFDSVEIEHSRQTKLIVAVKKDTDLTMIKNILSNNDIVGIVARADSFDYADAKQSLIDIINGRKIIPQIIRDRLSTKQRQTKLSSANKSEIKLTVRQNQILEMIVNRGSSNKMIAKSLNIAESTVKLHMGIILKKFGVRNRTQLSIAGKNVTTVV